MRLMLMADGRVGHEITDFLLVNYPEDLALVVTAEVNETSRLAEESGIPVEIYSSDEQLMYQLDTDFDLGNDYDAASYWNYDNNDGGYVNLH